MASYTLDEIDKQILVHLQENARVAATELAEQIGVSDNTIHHRLDNLEKAGIITGYQATLDLTQMGFSLYFMFICTVRITQRAEVAAQVKDIPEVVEVLELMTGQRNLMVKVVGTIDEDITRIATQLDKLDLEVNDENMIRAEYDQSLDFSELDGTLDE